MQNSNSDRSMPDLLKKQELIDQIADEFEQACRGSGSRPPFSKFLSDVSSENRTDVLHELIRIETAYRVRNGEEIQLSEYSTEFPEILNSDGTLPNELVLFVESIQNQENTSNRFEIGSSGQGSIRNRTGNEEITFQLPRNLGRFQLFEYVGGGSFGSVYKAKDCVLDRVVAVKFPKPWLIAEESNRQRFLKEAQTTGRLQHPHIVQLHEIATDHGIPYLVYEFVDGKTLEEFCAERRPSFRKSAELISTIARALDYAHRHNVIHRDVKPSNILMDQSDNPFITDFGLATQIDDQTKATLEGQILGTPAYIAPEQVTADMETDARCDVYSLGVVFYEMLSGERPFRGSVKMILRQVLSDEPKPLRQLNDKIPFDLETICHKSLSKSPANRYESANAFAEDLDNFLSGKPIHARPISTLERWFRWSARNKALSWSIMTIAILLIGTTIGTAIAAINFGLLAEKEKQARIDEQLSKQETQVQLSRSLAAQGILRIYNNDAGGLHDLLESGTVESLDPSQRQSRMRLTNAWADEFEGKLAIEVGHDDELLLARFFDEGNKILTATHDCRLRIWDANSGSPLGSEMVHARGAVQLLSAFVDHANHQIVSIDRIGTIKFWSLRDRKLTGQLEAIPGAPGIGYAHDGSKIALPVWVDGQRGIEVRDTANHAVQMKLQTGNWVHISEFSRDGNFVAIAQKNPVVEGTDEVIIYDCANRRIHWRFDAHLNSIMDLSFNHDGSLLATCSLDDTVKTWDLNSRTLVGQPLRHNEDVWFAAFSPTENIVASCAFDSTARIWNPLSQEVKTLVHDGPVKALAFDPTGTLLATGGFGTNVRVWNVKTGQPVGELMQHQGVIQSLDFHPRENRVISASVDHTARLWNLDPTTTKIATLNHSDRIWAIDFSPDSSLFVAACEKGKVFLWRNTDPPELIKTISHPGTTIAARFNPKSDELVTVDQSHIRIWTAKDNYQNYRKLGHKAPYRALEISPSGQQMVAATDLNYAVFFRQQEDGMTHQLLQHPVQVTSVAFAPDGSFFMTGCKDGKIRLWNATTGKIQGQPISHSSTIESFCLSRDGKTLATASRDLTIRFWNTKSWQPFGYIIRPKSFVQDMAFEQSGKLLATTGSNGEVQIWDVETGLPCGFAKRQKAFSTCVRFSPDGQYLATGGFDKRVRIWRTQGWFQTVDAETTRRRVWRVLGSKRNEKGTEVILPWEEWQKSTRQIKAK